MPLSPVTGSGGGAGRSWNWLMHYGYLDFTICQEPAIVSNWLLKDK